MPLHLNSPALSPPAKLLSDEEYRERESRDREKGGDLKQMEVPVKGGGARYYGRERGRGGERNRVGET